MPTEVTPSDGLEVNNTPPADQTPTPAKDADVTEKPAEDLPTVKPDQDPPVLDENTDDVKPEDEPEAEEVNHPEFDLDKTINLSDTEFDVVKITKANRLVRASGVNQYYKDNLLAQIKAGRLEAPYANMLRQIIKYDDAGQKYDGSL